MKLKNCPQCGESYLGDRWQPRRKLQQYCHECDWIGKPRTPEKQRISAVKTIPANHFSGFQYEVFDKYGHPLIHSQSYETEEEARKDLRKDLNRGKINENAGPYTAVLWPATVKVKGKRIK
jgi:hypothetical protein